MHAIPGNPNLLRAPQLYPTFPPREEEVRQEPVAGLAEPAEVGESGKSLVLARWASLVEPTKREERLAILAWAYAKLVQRETQRKGVQRIQKKWHELGEFLKASLWARRERVLAERQRTQARAARETLRAAARAKREAKKKK